MNKEEYLILRDREAMPTPTIWNAEVQTSPKIRHIYGVNLKSTWILFEKGRQISIYLKKDWERAGKYIAGNIFSRKLYFKNIEKEVTRQRKSVVNFLDEIKPADFSKFNFKELFQAALKIKKLWIDFDMANVPAWFIGGDYYRDLLEKKLKISQEDLSILTTPEEKTYASKFEEDFLKIIIALKKNKIKIEAAAIKLADEYGINYMVIQLKNISNDVLIKLKDKFMIAYSNDYFVILSLNNKIGVL